jgi:tetratricopeptide (TPR) repeat protein
MKRKEIEKKMKEAIGLAESGKHQEAADCFHELMDQVPNEPEIFYNAGICYSQAGEHIDALAAFDKAVELRPQEEQFLHRRALEEFQIGGGEVFDTDFLAHDPKYLKSALEHCSSLLDHEMNVQETTDLKVRIESKIGQNRLAFKYCDGDLEYCRKMIARKRELTNLDERVMGFLNLLDSGEYEFQAGKFGVVRREDLSEDSSGGFLNRIRNYVLGK